MAGIAKILIFSLLFTVSALAAMVPANQCMPPTPCSCTNPTTYAVECKPDQPIGTYNCSNSCPGSGGGGSSPVNFIDCPNTKYNPMHSSGSGVYASMVRASVTGLPDQANVAVKLQLLGLANCTNGHYWDSPNGWANATSPTSSVSISKNSVVALGHIVVAEYFQVKIIEQPSGYSCLLYSATLNAATGAVTYSNPGVNPYQARTFQSVETTTCEQYAANNVHVKCAKISGGAGTGKISEQKKNAIH